MAKARDITGQKFNHLTAIRQMPSKGGKTYWEFLCDCGNKKVLQTCHVTLGRTQDCGCGAKKVERVCPICNKTFIAELPRENTRKYCHNCSPSTNNPTQKVAAMRAALIKQHGGCCEKCGYNKCQDALEFHHLDPSTKDMRIANFGGAPSYERLMEEADKCILLCSNCHREEHARLRKEQNP